MVSGPSLRVTADTTIAQLKTFADGLQDGQRLRGKENKDGSITLYVSKGETSLMSKITGRVDTHAVKRDAGVAEAMKLMLNSKTELLGDHVPGDVAALFGKKAEKPSTDGLKMVADHISTLEKGELAKKSGADGPEFKELPFSVRADLRDGAKALGTMMGAQKIDLKAYDAQTDKMGKSLAEGLGKDPLASLYPGAILSDGAEVIKEIKAQILQHSGGSLGVSGEEVAQSLAEEVFRKASDTFLGGSAVKGSTDVVIGGKTYERKEMLGSPGGFGTAYRYQAKDGSGSIAVKFQNKMDQGTIDSFKQEIVGHKKAAASEHQNVLGFKGAMRTENGGFAIASELATGGEVSKAIPKILQAVKDGNITPEAGLALQLTLLKDLAKGLGDMHATSGMTHLDFKPPNAFITGDGVAKVADFGTAVLNENPFLTSTEPIQNPIWKDGAVIGGGNAIDDRFKQLSSDKADEFAANFFPKGLGTDGHIDDKLMKKHYGTAAAKCMERLGKQYGSAEANVAKAETAFDGRAYDMFALGVTAVGLITGEDSLTPAQQKMGFMAAIEQAQADYVSTGVLLVGDHPGAARPSTGNEYVDDLLNALTNPDPWKRPHDMAALLDMPAFNLAHVGSEEARDLLKGILKGDGNMIAEAMEWFA